MPECSAGPSEPDVNPSFVDPPPFNDIGALLDPEKSDIEIVNQKHPLRLENASMLFNFELFFMKFNIH